MNAKVVLLVIGLIVGAVVGYLTRPASAELNVGPLSIQIQGDGPAAAGDPMTSAQWQYVGILTVLGGVVGTAVGFLLDRRRV